MSAFPSWMNKTAWRKASAGERENMLAAARAQAGMSVDPMALMRGIPEQPAFLRGTPDAFGIRYLARQLQRRAHREQAEWRDREKRRRSCRHKWDERHPTRRACVLCGKVQ